MKELEKGMSLSNLESEIDSRDLDMEYRFLTRLNCHKIHYQNLYKSQQSDFKKLNRYPEVLPFEHSRVKLTTKEEGEDFQHI